MSNSDSRGEPIDVEFEPAERDRGERRPAPEGVGYGVARARWAAPSRRAFRKSAA
jgi:hypothetical protein